MRLPSYSCVLTKRLVQLAFRPLWLLLRNLNAGRLISVKYIVESPERWVRGVRIMVG
jgi:hypothetical protein